MNTYQDGYLQALIDMSWTCMDCGNTYQADIDECPNSTLDTAHAEARAQQWRKDHGSDE